MKVVATLYRDEDDVWIAEYDSIPGCVSQGNTKDEAPANIRDAIAACLEVRIERRLPLTIRKKEVVFESSALRAALTGRDVVMAFSS